jgi:hypothetical protein
MIEPVAWAVSSLNISLARPELMETVYLEVAFRSNSGLRSEILHPRFSRRARRSSYRRAGTPVAKNAA